MDHVISDPVDRPTGRNAPYGNSAVPYIENDDNCPRRLRRNMKTCSSPWIRSLEATSSFTSLRRGDQAGRTRKSETLLQHKAPTHRGPKDWMYVGPECMEVRFQGLTQAWLPSG